MMVLMVMMMVVQVIVDNEVGVNVDSYDDNVSDNGNENVVNGGDAILYSFDDVSVDVHHDDENKCLLYR